MRTPPVDAQPPKPSNRLRWIRAPPSGRDKPTASIRANPAQVEPDRNLLPKPFPAASIMPPRRALKSPGLVLATHPPAKCLKDQGRIEPSPCPRRVYAPVPRG